MQIPDISLYEKIMKSEKLQENLWMEYFLKHVLFSPQWWFLLGLAIIPWFFWWKLVDKRKLKEIIRFGSFIIILVLFLDDLGASYGLWEYPYNLIPVIHHSVTADFTFFPIVYMIIFQYFQTWKSFLIACGVFSFVFSFLLEPLAVYLYLYDPMNWEHSYSFVGFFLVPIICRFALELLNKVSK